MEELGRRRRLISKTRWKDCIVVDMRERRVRVTTWQGIETGSSKR